jgi:hypothetical protein
MIGNKVTCKENLRCRIRSERRWQWLVASLEQKKLALVPDITPLIADAAIHNEDTSKPRIT